MSALGGLAGIHNMRNAEANKREFGQKLYQQQIEAAEAQLHTFQTRLEEFARTYKKQIKEDPKFRNDFNEMCMQIGVDPLQSRNGFWSKLLGVGDFYHELSIKVIDVCLPLKERNGGMVPIEEVLEGVRKTYGKEKVPKISPSDIETALKNLKSIGEGYEVIKIGKKLFVKTVSFDMDKDLAEVLDLAKDTGYIVDMGSLKWTKERFDNAIQKLLQEGFVWVDQVKGQPPRYYVCALFPGFK